MSTEDSLSSCCDEKLILDDTATLNKQEPDNIVETAELSVVENDIAVNDGSNQKDDEAVLDETSVSVSNFDSSYNNSEELQLLQSLVDQVCLMIGE